MKIVRLFDIHWDKNSEPPKERSSSQMTIGGRRMLPYCFSKSSNAKRSCVRVKFLGKGNLAKHETLVMKTLFE
jgi:hypothetical protein